MDRPWLRVGLAAFLAPLLADALAQDVQRRPEIPKWEAVSVKPCAVRGPRGGGARLSPGRMALNCQPVSAFIAWAYVQYAGGRTRPIYSIGNGGTTVEGGPAWIYSDRYTIEATVNGSPSNAVMQGPMLQAILEDRFKVKVHTETREVPVYHVTVAPGGSKLRPFKPGTCVPINVHRKSPCLPRSRRVNGTATASSPRKDRHCPSMPEGSSVEEFVTLFLSTLSFAERPGHRSLGRHRPVRHRARVHSGALR
jgi:hypothetical protein